MPPFTLADPRKQLEEVAQLFFVAVLVGVLVSAYITEEIGIHAIFGAFILGAMMPKLGGLVRELSEKLEASNARLGQHQRIDGWLLYDFRGSNSALATLLPGKRSTTRRALLWIPARGTAVLLAHGLDAAQFKRHDVSLETYVSYQEDRTLSGPMTRQGELDTRDPFGGFLIGPIVHLWNFDNFPLNEELINNYRNNIAGSRRSPLDLENRTQYAAVDALVQRAFAPAGVVAPLAEASWTP